jgi:hypothetical protein
MRAAAGESAVPVVEAGRGRGRGRWCWLDAGADLSNDRAQIAGSEPNRANLQ